MGIKKYFNVVNEEDFTLLLVHIISCFIPNTPHHILIFLGNQGSAKTTACRFIKKLLTRLVLIFQQCLEERRT